MTAWVGEDFYRGWENTSTGDSLNIGKVPFRKRYALYMSRPGTFDPVAYFRNREDAERVADVLGAMIRADAEDARLYRECPRRGCGDPS